MSRKDFDISFSEMSPEKLGAYVINVQLPNLQKAFQTFLNCSQLIISSQKNESWAKLLTVVLEDLAKLIKEHFEHDERVLFPYIRLRIMNHGRINLDGMPVSLLKMKAEHQAIINQFKKLRLISNHYTPASDSPADMKLCYAQLFNFEQDMLKHIFIDEDILFPKLKQMQKI
jgi:iron-sulfur cluster repair protein YtfE (RIC family)